MLASLDRPVEVFLTRTFLFTVLPVVLGAGVILLDPSARGRVRQAEAMLIPLFIIGVAGNGIGGFIAHVFISDEIADSIGWDTGSPFQLEVGFANLAIGILGAIAAERRDGFREATVIAATVFAVGATFVHIRDILEAGNLAPGNTIQNVPNLLRPALLVFFLRQSRQRWAAVRRWKGLRRLAGPDPHGVGRLVGHRLDSVRGRFCHRQERTPVHARHPGGRRGLRCVGSRISSSGFVWMRCSGQRGWTATTSASGHE